jgi:hypothetical protein
MYRRPKFLEKLLEIRCGMSLEADYDVDLFAEMARTGKRVSKVKPHPSSLASNAENSVSDVPQLAETRDG